MPQRISVGYFDSALFGSPSRRNATGSIRVSKGMRSQKIHHRLRLFFICDQEKWSPAWQCVATECVNKIRIKLGISFKPGNQIGAAIQFAQQFEGGPWSKRVQFGR